MFEFDSVLFARVPTLITLPFIKLPRKIPYFSLVSKESLKLIQGMHTSNLILEISGILTLALDEMTRYFHE